MNIIKRFRSSERGTVGVIFGIAFVPMMLSIGVAIDYAQGARAKTALQHSLDTAVLTIASHPDAKKKIMSDTSAAARFGVVLRSNNNTHDAVVTKAEFSDGRKTFCATATRTIPTAFMRIVHIETMTVAASGCSSMSVEEGGTVEIALVLDNSGSMRRTPSGIKVTKMADLKVAATNFVNTVSENSGDKAKFSLVPFTAMVNAVDGRLAINRSLSWIDTGGNNSQHWMVFGDRPTHAERKAQALANGFSNRFGIYDRLVLRNSEMIWRGCFETPIYPLNVQDITPGDAETLMVPYLAPDEPNNYFNNNYIDDRGGASETSGSGFSCTATERSSTAAWNRLRRPCKYKQTAARTPTGGFGPTAYYGPSAFCGDPATQTLEPLTNDKNRLLTRIDGLVANGNTNLHEGIMWGWRTLSPNWPNSGARPYTAEKNKKIMVFMTDGFNNWNAYTNTVGGSDYAALGYYSYNGAANERLPDGSRGDGVNYREQLRVAANTSTSYQPQSRNAVDELTRQACTNAKNAGIEIYTIGFSAELDPIDEQGLAVLKDCATNLDHYFEATNAAQLNDIFQTVAANAKDIRLSQ